ncbi:MAG TPA: L,D-transpeptidase family protein [Firmicutes bacterium]|nr:L,D-transpeptidase family protein [Bacillota bacterium]
MNWSTCWPAIMAFILISLMFSAPGDLAGVADNRQPAGLHAESNEISAKDTDPGGIDKEHPAAAPAPTACDCPPDQMIALRIPRVKGRDVRGIQIILSRMGLYRGVIDGVYGPGTETAIEEFQRHHGLKSDGIVGPRTWHALARAAAVDWGLPHVLTPDDVAQTTELPLQPPHRPRGGTPEVGEPGLGVRVPDQKAPDPTGRRPGQVKETLDQPEEPIILVIDTEERTLTVYSRGKPFRQYPVAIGKPSTPSPPGEWKVIKKSSWSGGFGTRWMGLDVPWGIYGIHGTNKPWSIGDAVSGGCIRMHNRHVEELFQWVKIGTKVKIVSHPYDPIRRPRRLLGPGERGADVLLAERRLERLGYKVGKVDGVYDEDTSNAVKEFQKRSGLKATGEITEDVYDALGMHLFE